MADKGVFNNGLHTASAQGVLQFGDMTAKGDLSDFFGDLNTSSFSTLADFFGDFRSCSFSISEVNNNRCEIFVIFDHRR